MFEVIHLEYPNLIQSWFPWGSKIQSVRFFHVENAGFSKYTSTFIRALWAAEKKNLSGDLFSGWWIMTKKISQGTIAAIDT